MCMTRSYDFSDSGMQQSESATSDVRKLILCKLGMTPENDKSKRLARMSPQANLVVRVVRVFLSSPLTALAPTCNLLLDAKM